MQTPFPLMRAPLPLDADPRPPGCKPLWMQTPTPLDADPPWVGLTPGGWADPAGWTDPPGCRPPLGWGPSPRYGQQADGMHSTGMHTCYEEFFELNFADFISLNKLDLLQNGPLVHVLLSKDSPKFLS